MPTPWWCTAAVMKNKGAWFFLKEGYITVTCLFETVT